MRFIAAFCACVVFIVGVVFVYMHESLISQTFSDTATSVEFSARSDHLLSLFLVAGIAASLFLALLVYLMLAVRSVARTMAFYLSKDMLETRERFRKLFDLSPVPYLLVSKEGVISSPNRASLRAFGLLEDQLRGKDLFNYIRIPDKDEKLNLIKERLLHKVAVDQVEVQLTRSNGEVRWSLLSIEDVTQEASGGHTGLATLVDIHEQKELERIKSEFLSLASHQLRAPLANIKWYIDFLRTRRANMLNEEVVGFLGKMYDRNEDMIDLVNTLLTVSRLEMGRITVTKEQANIIPIVHSVVEELDPTAKAKGLTMVLTVPDEFLCMIDTKLVRIVLQNLLSNAVRYTLQGGTVTVRISPGASKVSIVVVDTGVGIPAAEQSRIFSKLYRATNAQAIETNGNGIGLYMCKALVESMGGTISFESVEGQGTTFTVVV